MDRDDDDRIWQEILADLPLAVLAATVLVGIPALVFGWLW